VYVYVYTYTYAYRYWMENKYTLRYTGGLVPDVYQYVPPTPPKNQNTHTHLNPVPLQK
jgi:hypothetical protein